MIKFAKSSFGRIESSTELMTSEGSVKLRAFGIQPEEFRNYKIGVRHAFRRSPNKHLIGSKPVGELTRLV